MRKERNLLQKEIAEKVGITQQNYSSIENGINKPSLKVAKKIADYFGVGIDELFFGDNYNLKLEKDNQKLEK